MITIGHCLYLNKVSTLVIGRPVFVAFVTAGYPTIDETVDILLALEKGGADVIELGK